MCGIVAVVRRPAGGTPPGGKAVAGLVAEGLDRLRARRLAGAGLETPRALDGLAADLAAAAERLGAADDLLKGVGGLRLMLDSPETTRALRRHVEAWTAVTDALDTRADALSGATPGRIERLDGELIRVRDRLWAIGRDRLGAARSVRALLGGSRSAGAVEAMLSVHQALSALDRLEVRGRDSAGLHLLIRGSALDLEDPSVVEALQRRGRDPAFGSSSARMVGGALSIVYKTAAEIGELGDNTAVLRAEVARDELLARALDSGDGDPDAAPVTIVLGHTRWASVGIISEPNAHPLDSDLADGPASAADGDYVVAAVNGDVDNYAQLLASSGVAVPPAVTTDSKVIPVLMSRRLQQGVTRSEAFRRTVSACEGSLAVAAVTAAAPERLQIALRGSGQGLYVGLASDAFIVASEVYGLVEETPTYVRMDGETAHPRGRGQIIEIDGARAGSLSGLTRWSYGGESLPIRPAEAVTAEITTRDIDRGDCAHFLLKEINEAPGSLRKTLRGRIVDRGDGPRVALGPDVLPERIRSGLRNSSIRRVTVIGQGTAAVAGSSLAEALGSLLHDAAGEHPRLADAVEARALVASELSAFHLRPDMSDTLVIAISQSGTTTDTNRTVDLARARGAAVVAVVNRRSSELTERADGVLYTSDGRDVEMSVASTKAFYAQLAAGWLLAVAVADEIAAGARARAVAAAGVAGARVGAGAAGAGVGVGAGVAGAGAVAGGAGAYNGAAPAAGDDGDRRRLLQSLLEMPEVLEEVLTRRGAVAEAARRLAPSRRHWAVVGSGPNRIAAREIRIKLSELCYKSIPSDVTEDKKHIDLSSEPLVMVCAAGLPPAIADDIAKEVAIFRAHRATPVVVADDGDDRYGAASAVLPVPAVDPRLVCLPVAIVGHLFGYEAALAIDAGARPLREARAAVDAAVARADVTGEQALRATAGALRRSAEAFRAGLGRGDYDGHLEASTAVRIMTVLRYALGLAPLESYEMELGRIGTPAAVIEDLIAALTKGIDELTRPVDAIRHQAKTVTVGISRSDEALLQAPLVRAVLAAGAPRERLSYVTLRTLAAVDPAVAAVRGHTRYRVAGLAANGLSGEAPATASVVDQGGIAKGVESRAAVSPVLTGTKHKVAAERRVLAGRGRHDGRTLVFVPEVSAGVTVGITLLHVRFRRRLSAGAARDVLKGYRNRYSELRDAVTETEAVFDEAPLGEIAPLDLLSEPIGDLADRWRAS